MTNEYNPDGKEIRFIDSHYKDLFRIPDGGCIQIHYPDETVVKPCTFIDESKMISGSTKVCGIAFRGKRCVRFTRIVASIFSPPLFRCYETICILCSRKPDYEQESNLL